ncbi:acyltransferase family protein [Demequina subtropica]|uniref:acyltransferase family protein n=1 Tax=Demequina subtropica TaxID=1638989 RepID=UPI00078107F9|nr:acyltransferase [Demequina subtropica]
MGESEEPAPRRQGRLQPLDGLRAVAVALVVIGHGFADQLPAPLAVLGQGGRGVDIFFVLSGYLITTLLTNELRARGRLDYSAFYARRALRILPAFLAFLAVTAALSLTGRIEPIGGDEFAVAALFVWNYAHGVADTWYLGHTWSLSVEEQFYVLWPLALVLLVWRARHRTRWLVALIVAAPAVRIAVYLAQPDERGYIAVMFHTRYDALLVGALLALLMASHREAIQTWSARLIVPALVLLFGIAPLVEERYGMPYAYTAGWTLDQACVAILIAFLVTVPTSRLARLLARRPLVLIGAMSYSIYLWQQLFLGGSTLLGSAPAYVGPLAAVATAAFSYYVIEKPFLRLKRHLARTELVPDGTRPGTEPAVALDDAGEAPGTPPTAPAPERL